MASGRGERKDAGSILAQPSKPGVVGLQDIDDMDERVRVLAAAEGVPKGTSDTTHQELERLAQLTPAQLLAMGSGRGSFASDDSSTGRLGQAAVSAGAGGAHAGTGRGAFASGPGAVVSGPAGSGSPESRAARNRALSSRQSSDMDVTDGRGGPRGFTRATSGGTTTAARRENRGQSFEVRVALEDKPGLVLASAGSTKSADDDAYGIEEPTPESVSGGRTLGVRYKMPRESIGSAGAAAMARALEGLGTGDRVSPEAAAVAQQAYRKAVRAESKRRLGAAAVAPLDGEDGPAGGGGQDGGGGAPTAAFYGGALKDTKGGPGPANATSRAEGDAPKSARAMRSTQLRSRLQQAGKTAAQVAAVSKKVPDVDPKCLLSKDSSMMRTWDVFMIALLLYTALLTPFEVSFVDSQLLDTWFWVNRVVDCGFLVDLVFNFFLPFYDPTTRREIKNHTAIALNYMKGWFIIDILSIFPFDIIFETSGTFSVSSDAASTFRIVRVIRLLKLAKLLRVVRASRIVKRWRTRVGLSFSLVQLISFLVYVLLLAHWSACGFYLVGTLTVDVPAGITSWVVEERIQGKMWDAYIASLYFSTMTTTTIGYGDIVPYNSGERLFTVFLMIMGGGLYAYVIGAIGTIVANFDGATSEHRANMDQLNRYTNELDLPQRLREELREYFAQTLSIQRERYYSHLLTFMSPKLRGHVAMHRHGEWIRHVPFFNVGNAHERIAFVTAVAMELQPAVFGKLERVMYAGQTINRMYIIQTGLATVQGRIVQRGHFFGEEAILTQARSISTVRALTYLDVFFLTKEALNRILDSGDFSETRKKIRYAVIRMALRRELLKCAALARIQNGLFRIAKGGALAYAPDPTADLELDHADAVDEENLAKPKAGQSTRHIKPSDTSGGRPPSPPPQGLIALATQASRLRAARMSEASRQPSDFGALTDGDADSGTGSHARPASRGRHTPSSKQGDLTSQFGSDEEQPGAATSRSLGTAPDLGPAVPGAEASVVRGSRPGAQPKAAGHLASGRASPTFGAGLGSSPGSASVGFGGPERSGADAKQILSGGGSVPPGSSRSSGDGVHFVGSGRSTQQERASPSSALSAGLRGTPGEQGAAAGSGGQRKEASAPAFAAHTSKKAMPGDARERLRSGPPGRRMSRPFSLPGQALALGGADMDGPFGVSGPASTPQGDRAGAGFASTPQLGDTVGTTSAELFGADAALSESGSAARRPGFDRGVLQRVLAKSTKLEADGATVNHMVGEVLGQVRAMESMLDKAASGIRAAQYIAATACLISVALLIVLLSRN